MTTHLGPSHTTRFGFDAGFLAQVSLSMHRKSPIALAEDLAGHPRLGDISAPHVMKAVGELPDIRVRQVLQSGARTLDLHYDASGTTTTALLTLAFELDAPLAWSLAGPRAFQLTGPARAELSVGENTSLAVTSDGLTVDSDGRCVVALGHGSTVITVSVYSSPVFRCGRTAVACRPEQLREAAIAASLLSQQPFTPIIPIAAPPKTKKAYLAAYAESAEANDDFMNAVGTPLAQEDTNAAGALGKQQEVDLNARMQTLRERLAPYRSWVKYNQMTYELLDGLGVDRVVLLHPFTDDDLVAADPGSTQGRLPHLFESIADVIRVDAADLGTLTDRLAEALGLPAPAAESCVTVGVDDHDSFVSGLFNALRTDRPIRAVATAKPIAPLVQPDTNEAVLVELDRRIDSLTGAQYAAYRNARLVTIPEPDLAHVQRTVADRQRAIGDPSAAPDWLARIEQAVSAQVPADAVELVGDRKLTAFTAGLPYSFVRSGAADWSTKPIGHVAADASLIVLNEIFCAGRERTGGRFAVVFDAGFFRRSETPAVVQAVRSYYTYPIVLVDRDANLDQLISLPINLPTELIFFNTHGADNAIVLQNPLGGSYPFARSKIGQWLHLSHRPIVVNNSCQSWTGVGREFIRVGARGYVGTLWSIPTDAAATVGETLIERITAADVAVAEALIDISGAGSTTRSYIYAGTVNGRLDHWPDRDPAPGEVTIRESQLLISAAHRGHPRVRPLLRREIATLRGLLTEADVAGSLDLLDVLTDELNLIVNSERDEIEAAQDTVSELFSKIDALLESLDLPNEVKHEFIARRLNCSAKLAAAFGDTEAALRGYQTATTLTSAPYFQARLQISTGQLMIHLGMWDDAVAVLEECRGTARQQSDTTNVVESTGVLGQLYKRLGRIDEAMECALEGYAAAAQLDLPNRRQAAFKNDESTLHEINGDLDSAMTAALESLRLARATGDARLELMPLGRLVGIRIKRGELASAERDALRALEQAESLGVGSEVASFQHDLARIDTQRGHVAQALAHTQRAIEAGISAGLWQFANGVTATLAPLVRAGDPAVDLRLFCLWTMAVIRNCPQLGQAVFEPLGAALIRVMTTYPAAEWNSTIALISDAADHVDRDLAKYDDAPDVTGPIRSLYALLGEWRSELPHDEIMRRATELDGLLSGGSD